MAKEYNFKEIEQKWHRLCTELGTYRVKEDASVPKYYVLNMFPYPSGAGLHVGHPLGYIASDIYARFKRLQGFNVLNPMGYDAYGLPAEQYAIKTGQHPEKTTFANIDRYREQLDKIGFSFDWDREVPMMTVYGGEGQELLLWSHRLIALAFAGVSALVCRSCCRARR